MGIEAMFSDCKTGGYNLEGSFANNHRLTSLIILRSIAYTATAISGKIVKETGLAKYIARLKEPKRKSRRHSNFWVGLYGDMWLSAWEFCQDFVQVILEANPHKRGNYQRCFLAMSKIESSF